MTTDEADSVVYELTDITVDTLGLVSQGANGEEFFLVKAADGATAFEPELEQRVTTNIWQRLKTLFQKAASGVNADTITAPTMTSSEPSADTTVLDGVTTDIVVTDSVAKTVATSVETLAIAPMAEVVTTAPTTTPVVIDVIKDLTAMETMTNTTNLDGGTPMADEVINKSDYDALAVRLEKAEQALLKAQDEKERQAWVIKAQSYNALPAEVTELAEQLHALAKWDTNRVTYWVNLLKAVDALARDANLFTETGSAVQPTSAIAKALTAADPTAALLALSKADQLAYLADKRAQIRQARQ